LELVKNGKFNASSNNGLGDSWKLNTWGESQASASSSNGAVTINISKLPTTNKTYDLQLVQAGIPLLKGNKYVLTFEAKAASARTISVVLQMPDDPWTDFLRDTTVALTTTTQTFTYEFDMTDDDFPNGRLGFDFGNATPSVTIGNVSLTYVGAGTTPSSSSVTSSSSSSGGGSSSSIRSSSSGGGSSSSSSIRSSSSRGSSSSIGTSSSSSIDDAESSSSVGENSPIRLISNISKAEFKVSSLSNKSLLIESRTGAEIYLYNINGDMAQKIETPAGQSVVRLSVPNGIYVVRNARTGQMQKVMVK